MIKCSGINNRLCRLIAAEHYEQVADHRSFLVVVEFYDLLVRELIERHLHHRDGSLNNLLTGSDDCRSLLTA